MKKQALAYLLILLCCSLNAKAQQTVEFSQYPLTQAFSTPAAVGCNDLINILGTFRSQSAGFEGAGLTYQVGADLGFAIGKTKHGAGFNFYDNQFGLIRFQDINLQYAYRHKIGKGYLSGGFDLGFTTISLDKDKIHQAESDYHDSSDPAIDNNGNDFKMNLGVGFMYKAERWYAIASLLDILQPEYQLGENTYFNKSMTLRMAGGYDIQFANPVYKLKTSALVATDFISWTGAVNATLEYKESYWGGLGYRIDGAVVFLVGIRVLNGLVIGYSFDLPTSGLINSAGGHEVVLSYSFKIDFSKKNRYESIRFL